MNFFPFPSCRKFLFRLALVYLMGCGQTTVAHGGVGMEDDQCIIRIGFLEAHFTGYQPQTNGTTEFCEDIPEVATSIFVIEYLHDFLREMQVDFRIIDDVNKIGVFANWDDVASLNDLEQHTVFYQPPAKQPAGVLTVKVEFHQAGGYIGIVTARHPSKDKTYRAVFYFRVGGTGYGYLPLFIGLVILAQVLYWLSNRATGRKTTGDL